MPAPELRLFVDSNFASPYALSAFVALREKGLAFEVASVNLAAKDNHEPAYAAASLTRRVPTLFHDGFALSESSAITEYVDEVFPGAALYPKDAQGRARARQVQAWMRSDFLPIREERSTVVVFRGPVAAPLSERAQASADVLFRAAQSLLPPGAQNLCGDWCIADVDFAMMLNRLVANGDPVPGAVAEYVRRQWQRPSIQEWVAKNREWV